jgi:hypothetical protein
MIGAFALSVSSEWLKQKRSLTFWLVTGSAFFVPAIIFLSRFRRIDALPAVYRADGSGNGCGCNPGNRWRS